MSGLFDELARTLATPMPRKRALRLLGSAVVVAAVPGFAARPAWSGGMLTSAPKCGGLTPKLCDNGKGTAFCVAATTTCCYFDDLVVGCRQCHTCGPNSRVLPCIGSDELRCGRICCADGEFCADQKRALCCTKGENYCGVIGKPGSGQSGGKATCCPAGTTCCQNDKRTDCCGPGQACKDGRCTCPKDKPVECGKHCCNKKTEHCSNGKCCPKGKKNCGDGRCCDDESDCCEKICCDGPGRICAGGKCCPAGRVFGSGKSARCCPPGTVVSGPASARTCCPKGDRDCCTDDELLTVLCQKGMTCVRGTCMKL